MINTGLEPPNIFRTPHSLSPAWLYFMPPRNADESSAEHGEGAAQCSMHMSVMTHPALLQTYEATQQESQ